MKRTSRILSMLRDLPRGSGRGDSAAALAERYGASARTIYRDMQLIAQSGYAITNDGEGYYLLATDRSVPVNLNGDEIAMLLCAIEWVGGAVPWVQDEHLRSALDKLTTAFGTRDAVIYYRDASDALQVRPLVTDGPLAGPNILTAMRARSQRRKLWGRYESPERRGQTERTIHPYGVAFRGQAHYLVGFCDLRSDRRTFRLDRFSELKVLSQRAEIPDDFDLDEHFAGAWQVTGGQRQKVRILFRGKLARRVKSQSLHETQEVIRETSEELELQFHVALTQELQERILSFGPDAEVISPKCLREEIRELAEGISANYRTI